MYILYSRYMYRYPPYNLSNLSNIHTSISNVYLYTSYAHPMYILHPALRQRAVNLVLGMLMGKGEEAQGRDKVGREGGREGRKEERKRETVTRKR